MDGEVDLFRRNASYLSRELADLRQSAGCCGSLFAVETEKI
jgi:hypothetical protein